MGVDGAVHDEYALTIASRPTSDSRADASVTCASRAPFPASVGLIHQTVQLEDQLVQWNTDRWVGLNPDERRHLCDLGYVDCGN